jgi:tRNA-2-methylthio-N6-dimethylallyladenosine synthase
LLNTCVVRQRAENKVLGRLNSLKSLDKEIEPKLLLVMGCFVDDPVALTDRFPHVDAFFGPSDVAGVLSYVDAWQPRESPPNDLPGPARTPQAVVDMVPISYGCDHACTYCVVTIRRGPQRSRPISEIVTEARALVEKGARDITLLGQNVDAYGHDLPGQPDLAEVLQAVHSIEDLWRIRFLTSHPRDMTQGIIDTVAKLPRVCKSWELAIQSGDDDILRRMGRGYSSAQARDVVARIREAEPACALNTDIIVGFPGERSEQFEHTLRLLENLRFDAVHVAAYSPRPGTPAANWTDDVPAREKERRRELVEQLQTEIAAEINARSLGKTVSVLVQGRKKGRWWGRTKLNKLVYFESERTWLGRLAPVRITWAGPWSMVGDVAQLTGEAGRARRDLGSADAEGCLRTDTAL